MRSSSPDDRGFGLPELLMAMSLASVLLLLVGTSMSSGLRTSEQAYSRLHATADARLALDTALRRLRVAVRPPGATSMFTRAEPYATTFYASVSPDGTVADVAPTLVEYALRPSGCLEEALTPATVTTASNGVITYSWPASSRRSRCLVFGNVRAAGASLFTYFGSVDGATPLAAPPDPVPVASLNAIRSVRLDVAVRSRAAGAERPTVARTRVTLVNRLNEDNGVK